MQVKLVWAIPFSNLGHFQPEAQGVHLDAKVENRPFTWEFDLHVWQILYKTDVLFRLLLYCVSNRLLRSLSARKCTLGHLQGGRIQ
jgi:hypothetical protein